MVLEMDPAMKEHILDIATKRYGSISQRYAVMSFPASHQTYMVIVVI